MKQFVVKKSDIINNKISLAGKDFNYIINVRRAKIGDKIRAIDEDGNVYNMTLTVISKETCSFNVCIEDCNFKKSTPEITLIQCLPKGKKMDTIIRQATEVGVDFIIPVISQYCIAIPDDKSLSKKVNRWNTICTQAIQQSGSLTMTKVLDIVSFKDMIEEISSEKNSNIIKLFCHHIESKNSTNFHKALSEKKDKIFLIIGPEGGLSDNEVNLLIKNGFKSIHFGKNILRCETAPIYALGAIKTILTEIK